MQMLNQLFLTLDIRYLYRFYKSLRFVQGGQAYTGAAQLGSEKLAQVVVEHWDLDLLLRF